MATFQQLLVIVSVASLAHLANSETDISTVIEELFRKTADLQVKKTTTPVTGLVPKKDAGIYESEVKIYAHGTADVAFFRDWFAVFDNNMFVTAWVTSCLLEAARLARGPSPSRDQLELALSAIAQYRDHNRPIGTAIYAFWPQVYNKTTDSWQSAPENLLNLFESANKLPVKFIEDVLNLLGMKHLAQEVTNMMNEREHFARAFHIPPDFDDTFVNLGLGALLLQVKASFPDAYESWERANPEVSSVLSALKQYAYRPFSNDSKVNSIDPRTYFYMRHFLENAKNAGKDVALVPTWVQDLGEVRQMYYKGVAMPFNINNVDVTVSANVIFGLTSACLTGLLPPSILDDSKLQQVYLNTTAMIADQINTDFYQRRDLALTYYPSVFEFYWFTARTYAALLEAEKEGPLPHKTLPMVMQQLGDALKGHMTSAILAEGQKDSEGKIFFDDFLGDGDVDRHNNTVVRAEDRIFTTAMAANALLSTWTVFDVKKRTLSWTSGAPDTVKETVRGTVSWLVAHSATGKYKAFNAFFSGSGKGLESMPFFFPANRLEFLNGTRILDDQHFPKSPYLIGFQGVVTPEQYEEYLAQPHFGQKTTTKFPGFNSGSSFFPFWSSEAYTYATSLLALAKFQALEE